MGDLLQQERRQADLEHLLGLEAFLHVLDRRVDEAQVPGEAVRVESEVGPEADRAVKQRHGQATLDLEEAGVRVEAVVRVGKLEEVALGEGAPGP